MRHLRLGLILALPLLLVGAAFSQVTLQFNNVGGNQLGGEFTYPYDFSINGTGGYTLMCDDIMHNINFGQSWQANAAPLTVGNVAGFEFGGQSNAWNNYQAAGLIFLAMATGQTWNAGSGNVSGSALDEAGNWAVWAIFESNGNMTNGDNFLIGKLGTNSTAQAIFDFFVANYGSLGSLGTQNNIDWNALYAQLSSVIVYTPLDNSAGGPQEFFGLNTPVPEPTSLMLMGTGLLAVAGAVRKKLSN